VLGATRAPPHVLFGGPKGALDFDQLDEGVADAYYIAVLKLGRLDPLPGLVSMLK